MFRGWLVQYARTLSVNAPPAENLADGHAEQFARQIPQRDLDAGDAMDRDAMIAPEVRDPPHHLGGELVDIERVLPDEHLAERVQDGVLRSQARDIVMALADAVHAGIGFDFDQGHRMAASCEPASLSRR